MMTEVRFFPRLRCLTCIYIMTIILSSSLLSSITNIPNDMSSTTQFTGWSVIKKNLCRGTVRPSSHRRFVTTGKDRDYGLVGTEDPVPTFYLTTLP